MLWISLFVASAHFALPIISILYTDSEVNVSGREPSQYYLEKQQIAIDELREAIQDVVVHDFESHSDYLLRWLRATNFKVKSAETMFRNNQKWRKENRIDEILNETLTFKNGPLCQVDGFDKEGDPLLYFRLTKHDIRKEIIRGNEQKFQRALDQCVEHVLQASVTAGKSRNRVPGGVALYNAHGYTWKLHGCVSCSRAQVESSQRHLMYYPEITKLQIIVNSPKAMNPMLDFVVPVMTPHMKETIHIFGPEKSEWTKFIGNHVAPDQLWEDFGGERVPDFS